MSDAERTDKGLGDATKADTAALQSRREVVIDARLQGLVALYGDRWNDDQRASIRARVARGASLAEELRRTPLTNGDEPEIVFVPFRGED